MTRIAVMHFVRVPHLAKLPPEDPCDQVAACRSARREKSACGSDVVATLYVVTQRASAPRLVQLTRQAMTDGDVLAGVSELPNGCGASVRLLGPTSKSVRAAVANAWNAVRLALLGAPVPELRKG